MMARCTSLGGEHRIPGSKGRFYIVTIGPVNQSGASCTCPDYVHRGQYSGEYCKHISQVLSGGCSWNQLHYGGEPVGEDLPDEHALLTRRSEILFSLADGVEPDDDSELSEIEAALASGGKRCPECGGRIEWFKAAV